MANLIPGGLPQWWYRLRGVARGEGDHPLKSVSCVACSSIFPMRVGPGGKALLPLGWISFRPIVNGEEGTEFYASSDCAHRGHRTVARIYGTTDIIATKVGG
jgi:hypothetical protein